MTTLFERLRDAPAICMIPQQGGVGTPTVGLTERERVAVLDLVVRAESYATALERIAKAHATAEHLQSIARAALEETFELERRL